MKIKSVSYVREKTPSKNLEDCSKTIVTSKGKRSKGRNCKVRKMMMKQLCINQVQRSPCAPSLSSSPFSVCYTPINYLNRKFTIELSQRLKSDTPAPNIAAGLLLWILTHVFRWLNVCLFSRLSLQSIQVMKYRGDFLTRWAAFQASFPYLHGQCRQYHSLSPLPLHWEFLVLGLAQRDPLQKHRRVLEGKRNGCTQTSLLRVRYCKHWQLLSAHKHSN